MKEWVVVQKAVIAEGNKYLILKRSPKAHAYPNCWDFAGGKLEAGEDISESVEREVLEETSLKVKAIRPVFIFHEFVNSHPSVFILYQCNKISGKIRLSEEHTEFKWATKEEILKLKTEKFLRAFLKTK